MDGNEEKEVEGEEGRELREEPNSGVDKGKKLPKGFIAYSYGG